MNNKNCAIERPLRVLLVEDSDDDATLILHHLQENGIETDARIVSNEVQFAANLTPEWDIILCDYNLPDFSPRAALELLRDRQLNIPLLIISGDISQSQAAQMMLNGARDFVDKSNLSRLLPAIQRELSVSRLQGEKREIERRIAHLANFDETTALPNHNYFFKTLEGLLRTPADNTYVVTHLNIDRLSTIADMHGSSTSDAIAGQIAARMQQFGNNSLFAKLGTNDYCLLTEEAAGCSSCNTTSEAIHELFREPFLIDKREHFFSPSLGISCYPCQADSAEKLIRNAKYAMEYARRQQLPTQHYDIAIEQESIERVIINDRLPGAIKQNAFSLFYQPKMDAGSSAVTALEVLLRWNDEQLGQVSPARFIPIAEETGDIMAIGLWVLEKACLQARQWRDNNIFNGRIAVNLSMRQLRDVKFAETVKKILEDSGFPAEQLELEITETDIMQDSELSISILQQLQALGISLVIDDFGTGYSSLSYLKRLPICTLKIDRTFIADIDNSSDSMAIVEAIMALARSLKLTVVAEGVETEKQLQLLEGLGCDEMQGYYISRPVDGAAIERYLSGLDLPTLHSVQQ